MLPSSGTGPRDDTTISLHPSLRAGATGSERRRCCCCTAPAATRTTCSPLGRMVAPGSALLSPRGKVLEHGMPRFFRRLAEGVFDEDDVRRRADELADFVEAARAALRHRGADRARLLQRRQHRGGRAAAAARHARRRGIAAGDGAACGAAAARPVGHAGADRLGRGDPIVPATTRQGSPQCYSRLAPMSAPDAAGRTSAFAGRCRPGARLARHGGRARAPRNKIAAGPAAGRRSGTGVRPFAGPGAGNQLLDGAALIVQDCISCGDAPSSSSVRGSGIPL